MNIKLKRIVFSAAIMFFICVILCIIASTTIYNLMLPRVETTFSTSGTIKSTLSFNGVFTSSQPIIVKNVSSLPIKETHVLQDEIVAIGDALFTVDTSAIDAQLRQCNINIQRQQNDINGNVYTGGDRLVKQMELDALLAQRNTLVSQLPKGGKTVKAEADGIVDFVNIDKSNNEILHIYPESDALNIEFEASITDLAAIKSESTALIAGISAPKGNEQNVDLQFIDARPSKTNTGAFTVTVSPSDSVEAQHGQGAKVKAINTSQNYKYTLPLSAVNQGADVSYIYLIAQRQSMWGVENYVEEVKVVVENSNYSTAAISSDLALADKKIVQYTSKPLKHKDAVLCE